MTGVILHQSICLYIYNIGRSITIVTYSQCIVLVDLKSNYHKSMVGIKSTYKIFRLILLYAFRFFCFFPKTPPNSIFCSRATSPKLSRILALRHIDKNRYSRSISVQGFAAIYSLSTEQDIYNHCK